MKGEQVSKLHKYLKLLITGDECADVHIVFDIFVTSFHLTSLIIINKYFHVTKRTHNKGLRN